MIILDLLVLLDGNYHGFLVATVFLMLYLVVENRYEADSLDKWIYIAVYCLNIFAFLLGFYRIEWFDDVAHTITPLAVVMFTGPYIYKNVLHKRSVSVLIKFFALVTLGVTIGVFWEVWEYFSNVAVFEKHAPTMHDTITDILFDTVGTVIGTIIVLIRE